MKSTFYTILALLVAISTSQASLAEEDWRSLITGGPALGYTVRGATKINVATAKLMHDQGAAFVDLRRPIPWFKGRIPNAVRCESLSEKNFLSITPKDQNIVFYCDGVGCELSVNASAMAVKWGFQKVFHFSEGYSGWSNAGLSVEQLQR